MQEVLPQQNTSLQARKLGLVLRDKSVLNDVNLDFNAGRVYSIIGPNGAGKSSLLKVFSGELSVFTGEARLAGRILSEIPRLDLARSLATLPQSSNLNFPFTVQEVVSLSRTPHCSGKMSDDTIVSDSLRAMDIWHLRERLYTQLSGGEKQRTQIARVLAQVWREKDTVGLPRVLLLDEPTAFLDLGHQQQLLQKVRSFAEQGVTVLMVLHDINLAANFADDVIVLQGGNLIAAGPVESVLKTQLLEQLFAARIESLQHTSRKNYYILQR